MEKTLQDIFKVLLTHVGSNQDGFSEDSLKTIIQEFGLEDEDVSKIKEAFSYLDSLHGVSQELKEAHDKGYSTQRWLGQRMNKIFEKTKTDEESRMNVGNAMLESAEDKLNTILKED